MTTPDALKLAALLDADPTHSEVSEQSAAMLRQQHAALESLQSELLEQARIVGMGGERELALMAQVESLRAARVPDGDAIHDLIGQHLTGMYYCTRVWSAWGVGTMSEDDFTPADETDFASDLSSAIVAMLSPTPPQPEQAGAGDEDALQGAACWIVKALDGSKADHIAEIQQRLLIGYNRAARLYDAALTAQEQKGAV